MSPCSIILGKSGWQTIGLDKERIEIFVVSKIFCIVFLLLKPPTKATGTLTASATFLAQSRKYAKHILYMVARLPWEHEAQFESDVFNRGILSNGRLPGP